MAALDHHFVARKLWLLIAVVTFPLTALAALAGPGQIVPLIFVTGYFLLVPLFLLFGDEMADLLVGPPEEDGETTSETAAPESSADPLETLKRQYASGEIGEREFERRVERLVALDDVDASDADLEVLLEDGPSLDDGRVATGRDGAPSTGREPKRDGDRERETDVEREL